MWHECLAVVRTKTAACEVNGANRLPRELQHFVDIREMDQHDLITAV